jgi:nucleoside diphosphate kinase
MSGYFQTLPSLNCAWKNITRHIVLVEDPVYSMPMELSQYIEIYGALLDTLDGDGEDSQVSHFYELSRVNTSILVFKNEDARIFFREEAEDMDLIPKLIEVCEGETKVEKMRRTQSENKIKQAPKANIKKNKSEDNIAGQPERSQEVIRESAKKQRTKLLQELNLLQSQVSVDGKPQQRSAKIEKIENKIKRINEIIGVESDPSVLPASDPSALSASDSKNRSIIVQ